MSRPHSACQSARVGQAAARPLSALPKAHLHLHLTGAMRHATLIELAGRHGIRLPTALTDEWPPQLSGVDERGWFRFQRLYDMARSVLRTPADLRRLVAEIAEDERAEGSGWLEVQVDPDGYAARFGGITGTLDLVLAAAAAAPRATGVGIGVIVAANRTKHPLEARTLARLAGQYAGRGVTGFGLSNDERRRPPPEAARGGAGRPGQGGRVPGRPARRPDRPRRPRGRGSGAGQTAGRRGGHLRGLPLLERRARRRAGPSPGPAADPGRGGRAGRARRR